MKTIKDYYNAPFGSYKHILGHFVVRPLDWCIVGQIDKETGETIITACNSMLRTETKEEADIISNTFNHYFELLELDVDKLKAENEKLEYNLNEYTALYKEDYTKVAIKKVISLIKYHCEKDEDNFKVICKEIIKDLFDSNNNSADELARYIQAQICEASSFVPMEKNDD